MAYLMHIGFDSSARFYHRIYYFQYKGVQYKLIQHNPRRHCDALLTKADAYNSKQATHAYETASEFLSALSWEHNSRISVWYLGGGGFRDSWHLRRARCSIRSYPRTPFAGGTIGCNIQRIPKIETDEQRKALLLYREARASNNYYLSFLFYWQVLEIGAGDSIGWINKTYKRNRSEIQFRSGSLIEELPKSKLGNYFYDDCRCAIAHIKRKPGKKLIRLENPEDSRRIAISTQIIKGFSSYYIEKNLKLNKHLYLYKKNGRGIPKFLGEDELYGGRYTVVYNMPTESISKRRRWYYR
jgi:methylamine utilization protein MauJ